MEPYQNTGVGSENTGVTPGTHEEEDEHMGAEPEESAGVDPDWPTGVEDDHENPDEEGDDETSHDGDEPPIDHEMDERYGARTHQHNLRPRRARSYAHKYGHDEETMLTLMEHPVGQAFLMAQMSVKKGLRTFGEAGASAVVEEMRQLEYRDVLEPVHATQLTRSERMRALRYLMYLKQKRCGRIKARGCADGRKQRVYKTKDETSSPTVSLEALFLTAAIDAQEGRKVITVDIPGAFMHAEMDETVHMKIDGPMAELLCRVDSAKYSNFVTYEKGKPVVYVKLKKALYGTLQAALLFWENLSGYLVEELGFVRNPYDGCVVNKIVEGKQCTIIWHVDDLKLSHVKQSVLEDIVSRLNERYGKETPVTVHRGAVHDYLGMTIDYSKKGQVTFDMTQYLKTVLDETPDDMSGTAITPAGNKLFDVNPKCEKLEHDDADVFHHITARLLYLCKRARPDIQTAVSFLCTRVQGPDRDDWKKLARCVRYLRGTPKLCLTLQMDQKVNVRWWIDASFGVHPDLRSHTGATMSLGKGSVYSISRKQKLNTRSSTEAELVGVDDGITLVLWTRLFLLSQGFAVSDNVVYQDNQSAMRLEGNGRSSCGRQTRHFATRYFYVTGRIREKELRVEYCPTEDMLADFFTKPLQGSLFRRMRQLIMNLPGDGTTLARVPTSQECVGARTYASVVRWSDQGKDDVDSGHTNVGTRRKQQ